MGKLIVIEGTDGSGKSTQFARLSQHLQEDHIAFKHFERSLEKPKKDIDSRYRKYCESVSDENLRKIELLPGRSIIILNSCVAPAISQSRASITRVSPSASR